jgi:F-type H+-transporting ATPase subunit gamma
MIAMQSATDNANELVAALQLQYNKVRQTLITSDILDIAGGAEALAQVKSIGGENG